MELVTESGWAKSIVPALFVVVSAALGYWFNRVVVIKRATLDLIVDEQKGEAQWSRNKVRVRTILRDEGVWQPMLTRYVKRQDTPRQRERALVVLNWINHYEIIGLLVKHKAMHGPTYYSYIGPQYWTCWALAEPFILRLRGLTEEPDIYENFERQARAWRKLDQAAKAKRVSRCRTRSPPRLNPIQHMRQF